MKTLKHFAFIAVVLAAVCSCNKNDDSPEYQHFLSTVTFRPQENGTYFLKQDEKTALLVLNEDLKEYPFEKGKEKRAYIEYAYNKDTQSGSKVEGFEQTIDVYVVAMDTIITQNPVAFDPDNDKYGNDPVGVYTATDIYPTTFIEDGYLNLRFELPYGYAGVVHEVNLLTGVKQDDPYYVEFRHNANGDGLTLTRTFIIDFPLKSLPDTEGETVKLTLGWDSIVSGKKETISFDYCSRTDW